MINSFKAYKIKIEDGFIYAQPNILQDILFCELLQLITVLLFTWVNTVPN